MKNALLSALPYLVMCLLSFFFSFLSGVLEKRNFLPLKYSRKVFNTIGKHSLLHMQKNYELNEFVVALRSLDSNGRFHCTGFQQGHDYGNFAIGYRCRYQ